MTAWEEAKKKISEFKPGTFIRVERIWLDGGSGTPFRGWTNNPKHSLYVGKYGRVLQKHLNTGDDRRGVTLFVELLEPIWPNEPDLDRACWFHADQLVEVPELEVLAVLATRLTNDNDST